MRVLCLTVLTLTLVVSSRAGADNDANCTQASLEGSWGFTLSGTLIPSAGVRLPVAAVGTFAIDSSGSVSGGDTTSVDGTIFPETFTGTATVNPHCTGSAMIISSVLGVSHFDFVLTTKRKEILLIRKDLGTVIFGSAQQQSD